MKDQRIQAYLDRGLSEQEACALLCIPYTPPADVPIVDKDELRNMAIDTLAALIRDMQRTPTSFKPTEIIAACREALDRTEGKPGQVIAVESKATVTHEHVMSMSPADAYRMLTMDGVRVSGLPALEATPLHAGGDGGKQATGVNEGEATPQIYYEFLRSD